MLLEGGGAVRAVDVAVALGTARFDRPLTYCWGGPPLGIGDIVRVPVGTREHYGYVVSPERAPDGERELRAIAARVDLPRAFDAEGLGLARWLAETYLCSLGEALATVVLADAVPRVAERIVPVGDPPAPGRFPSVPDRLVALIWGDLRGGFAARVLLHHPEARRAGDRRVLTKAVATLVRAGFLERRRSAVGPAVSARTVRVLVPGEGGVRGRRAAALAAYVCARGEVRRADAELAGFTDAVVRRALAADAIRELQRPLQAERRGRIVLPALVPTAEQQRAIEALAAATAAGRAEQFLLHGTTGSGKTLVYIHAIARVVADGGRAIVLVPEIALTPQTAQRFEAVFGERVAVVHSALSERERYEAWQAAARGDLDVIVGARSAVFAPLPNLRMIVVDEEHEASYRQEHVPRYHAVEVARERMRRRGGVVVLGSATPALEDYARALARRLPLVRLGARATAQGLPRTTVIDMAEAFAAGRHVFSTPLIEALAERLRRGEKSVLFVNRRGAARFVLCRACGFVPACTRCATSLVLHRAEGLLRCHYCDAQQPSPERCLACGEGPIAAFGVGTERVVADLQELFPAARIVRMDADTTTRVGDHARLLERFAGEGDVLVGTQMVAKGLDFPEVTLVGALAADADLHVPDYRAAERTFALIVQVCGRSGRARPGEAIVQTFTPQHPAIALAARHDYVAFAQAELAERRELRWPPFVRLVFVGAIGRERTAVVEAIERYATALRGDERWEVLGPAPYPLARRNDEWRYRIALKTRALDALRAALRAHILPLAERDRRTRLAIVFEA